MPDLSRRTALAALMLGAIAATAQVPQAPGMSRAIRPLTLHQAQYRLRAGESAEIDAPPDTLDFLLHAQIRSVEIDGQEAHGIVVGPNRAADRIFLAASIAMKAGEYTVTLSVTAKGGERRDTTLGITVDALTPVPSNATEPPVILLNGWQAPGLTSNCPLSAASETFGDLASDLTQPPPVGDNVPVVYWFDNCAACPNCSIETLGGDLAQAIGSIQYDNGTPVPQVDLIAHSMGGLTIRSYLSGKQIASGVFDPPPNPHVRKAIFIATPHFGSFQADNPAADVFFFAGSQTNEMKPGSQFLFDLAKWNQFQDDLRGTDALGIIGNAGSYNGVQETSDGVVSLTSASLKLTSFSGLYAEPDVRTRIVDYCHIDFTGTASSVEGSWLGCIGPGIAYIDSTLHPTYRIIQSFLADTATWTTIGTPPSQDPYLSGYGGVVIGEKSANDQYLTNLTSMVTSANLSFAPGPSNSVSSLFYDEWVPAGNYNVTLYNSTGGWLSGNLSAVSGGGMAMYYKDSPTIRSVGPLINAPGLTVGTGSTITISGLGFGSQLCSGCQVLASAPGSTTAYLLPVSSWSDQTILASFVPANLPNLPIPGYVTIYVQLSASAWDSINIMAASAPILAIAKSHTGSFTQGQNGAAYTVIVSNAASAGPTSGTVTVTETAPSGLTLISMTGASWTCSSNSCFRSDSLSASSSYSPITVTTNVASNASSQVTNQVTVSGGGSVSATANDVANVLESGPALAVATPASLLSGFVGSSYSETLSATGGTPPYYWSLTSGALPGGLTLDGAGTISGTPTTAGSYSFTARVTDSAAATATKPFALTVIPVVGSLARMGVLSQFAAGGGWDTTIWVMNSSSAAVPIRLVFHGDDGTQVFKTSAGTPVPVPLTITQQGNSQVQTLTTLDRVLNPNTTLAIGGGLGLAPNVEGWIDLLGTSAVSGFAVFRYAPGGLAEGASGFVTPWEGTVPLQSQVSLSTMTLPFDNTNGFATGIAIGSLSASAATITATFFDVNGNALGSPQTISFAANGHTAFMVNPGPSNQNWSFTAGQQGIVRFTGAPMMGLGLRASPYGTLTSVPTVLQ